MHKYEKWWMVVGMASMILFLAVVGVNAFHYGSHPPSSKITIDSEKVDQIAPFNNPGVHKVSGKDWDYEVVFVASTFYYDPPEIEVPLGSRVKFIATTKDVIHGFEVAGTNINMMLEPGYVSTYETTVKNEGEYLILCNEYCGVGHAGMTSKLKVVAKK